ncbi:hypothetical protein EYF80_027053 [Liparis tanakae]|uniref:Uncharacterized protein n=1 Tax=Liparis tanakae TaxID=230148 RepID=A0A4Z2HAS2_9TELE|nr:hypothetical protein EYF80_027053 [Liparis tanakae]
MVEVNGKTVCKGCHLSFSPWLGTNRLHESPERASSTRALSYSDTTLHYPEGTATKALQRFNFCFGHAEAPNSSILPGYSYRREGNLRVRI